VNVYLIFNYIYIIANGFLSQERPKEI